MRALVVDAAGNVYVTGRSSFDYATLKYDPDGTLLWEQRYDGPANGIDDARALAVDGAGNVYVTGGSGGPGATADYSTLKYDPDGTLLWEQRYDGPANEADFDDARALAVDGVGNVYVTGWSTGVGTDRDYATLKYDPDGNLLWEQRYNAPRNGFEGAVALEVDGAGNVYVTGSSDGAGTSVDYATIKYIQP